MITLKEYREMEAMLRKVETAEQCLKLISQAERPDTPDTVKVTKQFVIKEISNVLLSYYDDYADRLFDLFAHNKLLFECQLLDLGLDVKAQEDEADGKEEADNQ